MMRSNEQIEAEFDVYNCQWINMLIEVIKGNEIRNFDALSIAGKVAKHVEQIEI